MVQFVNPNDRLAAAERLVADLHRQKAIASKEKHLTKRLQAAKAEEEAASKRQAALRQEQDQLSRAQEQLARDQEQAGSDAVRRALQIIPAAFMAPHSKRVCAQSLILRLLLSCLFSAGTCCVPGTEPLHETSGCPVSAGALWQGRPELATATFATYASPRLELAQSGFSSMHVVRRRASAWQVQLPELLAWA